MAAGRTRQETRPTQPSQESHGFLSRLLPFRGREEVTSIPQTPQPRSERSTLNLQDYLPPPFEDRQIQKIVDEIKEHLHNHVEFFYIDSRFDVNTLRTLPEQPGEDQHEPTDPTSRGPDQVNIKTEIKRVIATRLIRGIQPFDDSDDAGSLLPHEISRFLLRVPDPADIKSDQAYAIALSQWRVLSWYLLNHADIREDNERTFQKRLEREAQTLIVGLEGKLQPYIDKSKDEEARREHLTQLIRLVAGLGRIISAQPASYQFSWDYVPDDLEDPESESQESRKDRRSKGRVADEGRGSRPRAYYEYDVRVLFPALLKKNIPQGQRSHRRICVCEPEIDRLVIGPVKRRTTDQVVAPPKGAERP